MKRFINFLLIISSCSLTLWVGNLFVLYRFTGSYDSKSSTQFVQHHLKLHSTLGYLWKDNLRVSDPPRWQDQAPTQLMTDDLGFKNPEEAILLKESGKRIDIIGLGDSFIHDASDVLFEFFKGQGLFYYSMAMHRHSPPQYNIILKDYVAPVKPKWIIYGLYENDFIEASDFNLWRQSGVNWFDYHSGIWYGAPKSFLWYERILANNLKGFYFLYLSYNKKMGKLPARLTQNPDLIANYIQDAYNFSEKGGMKLLPVFIPSKVTTLYGRSPESPLYDELASILKEKEINFLDLRPHFWNEKNRERLYYNVDPHWNKNGIMAAAPVIFHHLQK